MSLFGLLLTTNYNRWASESGRISSVIVKKLNCTFLQGFYEFLFSSGAEEQESDCLFVSHLTGEDSPQCGSFAAPCRTLPQALHRVNDGGKICLDGDNSKSHPYNCLKTDDPNGAERKLIEKGVTIQGVSSEAHISCGLAFATPFRNGFLKVTLSNLVFNNTSIGLLLVNVSSFNVVITKCKFINCHKVAVGLA